MKLFLVICAGFILAAVKVLNEVEMTSQYTRQAQDLEFQAKFQEQTATNLEILINRLGIKK